MQCQNVVEIRSHLMLGSGKGRMRVNNGVSVTVRGYKIHFFWLDADFADHTRSLDLLHKPTNYIAEKIIRWRISYIFINSDKMYVQVTTGYSLHRNQCHCCQCWSLCNSVQLQGSLFQKAVFLSGFLLFKI